MTFKPLLAATFEKVTPTFPVYASQKLDGIRCIIVDGVPMTRSPKKPVPNIAIQRALAGKPWLDGELVVGEPTGSGVCSATQSGVMSVDGEPDWTFFVFDIADPAQADLPYRQRLDNLTVLVETLRDSRIKVLPHIVIGDMDQLMATEDEWCRLGFEGVMIRSPDGRYKHGRATEREGILTKIKRFSDTEGVVVSVFEEEHNTNEAKKNALGKTERSSHKAGKVGKGALGGYVVELYRYPDGTFGAAPLANAPRVLFHLSASGNTTADWRKEVWSTDQAANLVGRTVKFKYQVTAGAEAPRFPVFLGFRETE